MITEEQGFTVKATAPLVPLVDVSEETRAKLLRVVAAAVLCGMTPQEIAVQVRSGRWRSEVRAWLARPGEVDELHGLVDVLLVVLQSPS